jgi:predicted nucleic acid-binding protein
MNTQPSPPAAREVFADTCILLSFVQREWEPTDETELIESDSVTIVVSESVIEELLAVSERRRDIYEDMVDYLVELDTDIEEYDPGDRHVYFARNDAKHVRNLQMDLAGRGDRREILRDLRTFVRAAGRRVEYLESLLADQTVDPIPPLELRFAMDGILNHDADTKIVTDAAAWTADGGSGVLVTRDSDHIRQNESRINELLTEEQGAAWTLQIQLPEHVLAETTAAGQGD